MTGLGRNFRICDTNGSGQLDEDELAKCCRLCKLTLKPDELTAIFQHFDAGGNGTVSFEEFVRTIRGKMNPPRIKLCTKVFTTIDALGDGSGSLTVEDFMPYYNTAEHPDVKSGDKTPEQVLQALVDGFEGTKGDGDGTVTLTEWTEYCARTPPPPLCTAALHFFSG